MCLNYQARHGHISPTVGFHFPFYIYLFKNSFEKRDGVRNLHTASSMNDFSQFRRTLLLGNHAPSSHHYALNFIYLCGLFFILKVFFKKLLFLL